MEISLKPLHDIQTYAHTVLYLRLCYYKTKIKTCLSIRDTYVQRGMVLSLYDVTDD